MSVATSSEPWAARYSKKVVTAARAIAWIKPGRRILIGSGAAEPTQLVDALVRDGEHLADNEIVHLLTLGPAPYVRPEFSARFRHAAFFIGPNVRGAVQEGRADFIPVFLSELPRLIESRRVPIDVALLQVSPPDAHGYVSLGVSVDIVRAAVAAARLVIAEVNPRMPRTHGDSFLPVADIDWLVAVDCPVLELPFAAPDAVSAAIGEHVAGLVPDGATLQTGIGEIPNAVLQALGNKHDLGMHTEMLSDAVIDLVQSGVLTGKRKTLLPGKVVTSFVMGTRRLYDWVDDNPAVEMRPSDFTNDPMVIARNDRMVAVNSALAVDLTGQVAADTLNGAFFSGIGGQVDFVRGAARSKGGKSVIALRSTARSGQVSRIQATFGPGAGVVTSRGDVRYVVTEYGIADLWGKSVRERSVILMELAHPEHRRELMTEAKLRKYVFQDQRQSVVTPDVVRPEVLLLKDGVAVHIRNLRTSDERALQDLFYRLSDDSVYQRFLCHKVRHSREEIAMLADFTDAANGALVATGNQESEELLGVARYDRDSVTNYADFAVVVRDDWHGRGIGSALFERLGRMALARGVRGFTADVLVTNGRMLAMLNRSGHQLNSELAAGVQHFEIRLDSSDPSLEPQPPLASRPAEP